MFSKFKYIVRALLNLPHPSEKENHLDFIGENSSIEKPLLIIGKKNIFCGENTSIGVNAWLGAYGTYLDKIYNPKIIIGNNVRIGNYACLTAINKIEIKDGCLFSEYVYVSDHAHGVDPSTGLSPKDQDLFSKGPVVINENCFIGYRVSILPNVTLGRNCVVGAHSVVTKSFPDYSMIAGSPAKLIKRYCFNSKDWIEV